MTATETPEAPKRERWSFQWKELYDEVITTGLCTGCAGCVISCPHDVIGYDHEQGGYKPFHLEDELGPDRLQPRPEGLHLAAPGPARGSGPGSPRPTSTSSTASAAPDEVAGIYSDILLTRASDDMVHRMGQDGGLVSAILIWAMDEGYIDAALTSFLDGAAGDWKAKPGRGRQPRRGARVGRQPLHLLGQHAGPRRGPRAGLLASWPWSGMSCQSSVPPVMWHRKIGKISKPIVFNIGLLCSKTFDDAIFEELFEAKYGLAKQDMVKMNIKGVFQIWMRDGAYHEINLKECHAWTREGCTHCPDFAAEHADISTGGIGKDNDWTLDHRAHRARPRDHPADDRRRLDHRPAGRRGPGRHRPDAQAGRDAAGPAGRSGPTPAVRVGLPEAQGAQVGKA